MSQEKVEKDALAQKRERNEACEAPRKSKKSKKEVEAPVRPSYIMEFICPVEDQENNDEESFVHVTVDFGTGRKFEGYDAIDYMFDELAYNINEVLPKNLYISDVIEPNKRVDKPSEVGHIDLRDELS